MIELDPIWSPRSQQQNFRCLLQAIARPGLAQSLPEPGSEGAMLAVLASLMDGEVTLSDQDQLLEATSWPLLQSLAKAPEVADFVLCRGDLPPSIEPRLGTLVSPEASATLLLQVNSVSCGDLKLRFTGPGVDGEVQAEVGGLHSGWLRQRQLWTAGFPLGVDLFLVDQLSVLGIPRTTHVEVC